MRATSLLVFICYFVLPLVNKDSTYLLTYFTLLSKLTSNQAVKTPSRNTIFLLNNLFLSPCWQKITLTYLLIFPYLGNFFNPLTPEPPVTARTRLHCFKNCNFLNRANITLTISCHHSLESPSNLDTQ